MDENFINYIVTNDKYYQKMVKKMKSVDADNVKKLNV